MIVVKHPFFFFLFYMTLFILPNESIEFIRKMKLTLSIYIYSFAFDARAQFLERICFLFYLFILTYYRHSSNHLTLSVLMNQENTREREREKMRKREECAIRSDTFIVCIKLSTNDFI